MWQFLKVSRDGSGFILEDFCARNVFGIVRFQGPGFNGSRGLGPATLNAVLGQRAKQGLFQDLKMVWQKAASYPGSGVDALRQRMGSDCTLSWFEHGCATATDGSEWTLLSRFGRG